MLRSRFAAALCAALVLSCAPVAKYQPRGELVPYQGFHARLPSGLQVVVYEVPQVERFSLTVSYGSGSADDPRGKEGLAHLVEHLLFRTAPPALGDLTVWDQLTASGWRFNASTDWDSTDYYVVGKPPELHQALRVEAERMRAPVARVDEDTFAVERDVVLAEYRERFETNRTGAQLQWVLEGAFEDHPVGRPIGGTPESLATITLADARTWAEARYVPENAILVVVSPHPSREVVRQVVEAFGELAVPSGPDRNPRARTVTQLPAGRDEAAPAVQRKAPVPQPRVWVAWPVPGAGARKEPQGRAAATALERAFTRQLFENLGSNALQRVESWGAFYFGVGDHGLVVFQASLASAGDAGRIVDMARSAAVELVLDDESGTPRERDRKLAVVETRDQLLVDAYLEIEHLDGADVAAWLRATGEPDYLAGRRKTIAATLNSDISSYAHEFLKRNRSTAVVVLPDANGLASALAGGSAGAGDHDDLEDGTWAPPGPDRVRAVARPPGFAAVARRVLPNGLTVYLAKRGTLPVAEVRLLLRTSTSGTPELPAGVPDFALATNTARFAVRGAQRVGASSWVGTDRDTVRRVTWGSAANLEILLESTGQWARDQAVRYHSELEDVYLRWVERRERDAEVLASAALLDGAFPAHPYAAPVSAAALKRGGKVVLARFLAREFRPGRATLVVASNQPESPELWAAIERHFGGWGGGGEPPVEAPEPAQPAARTIVLVDRPGASQAVLAVALRLPPWERRDRTATEAVAWLAQNRLMQRLRLEEGVTYGAHAGVVDHRRGAALMVSMAVAREAAASSLSTTLATARALAEGGISPAEAGRARWQVARRYAAAFDTVREAIAAIEEAAEHGQPPEVWDADAEAIAGLDAARMKAAAAALPAGRESVVLLGDAGVLRPQLEKAGFEVKVVKP